MTLDEAIKDSETISEECQRVVDTGIVFGDVTIDMLYCDNAEEELAKYKQTAENYRQLAEWLTDYKRLLEQESCGDAISRQAVLDLIEHYNSDGLGSVFYGYQEGVKFADVVNKLPPVNPQEAKMGWNNHQIACMLADLFGDACACNYNGIDEWLGELCDFKDTCCPNPVGVACWEQFLKYSQSRYTECGYEVRDKNALQEPKMGRWIEEDMYDGDVAYRCSECKELFWIESGTPKDNEYNFCPKCGKRLIKPQESDHKCHTCKHYTAGEHDGSCGSYICKEYSNWESEDKE